MRGSKFTSASRSEERGAYVVLFAGIIVGFFTLLALAVDTAHRQRIKLVLQRSVDSASVAATNLLEQQSIGAIRDVAKQVVIDNLTRSGVPVDPNEISVSLITPPTSSEPRQAMVRATVRPELYLLGPFVGYHPDLTADATATNVKRTVALVLDRSGSMNGNAPCDTGSCSKIDALKYAAKRFVELFGGDDRLALISFSTAATVDYSMTRRPDINQVKNIIDNLDAEDSTNTGDALNLAIQELNSSVNNDLTPSDLAAVVLITDGAPRAPNSPPGITSACSTALNGWIRPPDTSLSNTDLREIVYAIQRSDAVRTTEVGTAATGLFPRIFSLGIGMAGVPVASAMTACPPTNPNPQDFFRNDPFQCESTDNFAKDYILARLANDQALMNGDPTLTPPLPPHPEYPSACVNLRSTIVGRPNGQYFPITNLSQLDTVLQAIGSNLRARLSE